MKEKVLIYFTLLVLSSTIVQPKRTIGKSSSPRFHRFTIAFIFGSFTDFSITLVSAMLIVRRAFYIFKNQLMEKPEHLPICTNNFNCCPFVQFVNWKIKLSIRQTLRIIKDKRYT